MKLAYLKFLYREYKVDEDYAMEHETHYQQFYEFYLLTVDCIRCRKNKRERDLYCDGCYQIENTHEDGCYCAGHFIEGGCIYCRDVGAGESPVNDSDSDFGLSPNFAHSAD